MPRLFSRIALIVLCLCLMGMPVLAANSARSIESATTVATDASYSVNLTLQLNLEKVEDNIYFPIPQNAKNVLLYKSRPRTQKSADALQVVIPLEDMIGKIVIDYTVAGQVTRSEKEGFLELDIPLLGACDYPVEAMSFAVSLPGELDESTDPVKFDSATHGRAIETSVDSYIDGDTVVGAINKPLTDHTSLILHLTLPEEMLPGAKLHQWSVSFDDVAMYVVAAIALVYWLVFLRNAPVLGFPTAAGPEGLTAGELGTALIGQGGDLTMMVLSWAQMGYILIHLDNHGRVMLHKRMEMGNERSGYEQKCFRLLFGKQNQANGTGVPYAHLVHKVRAMRPENRGYYRRRSGSVMLFRILVAVIGGLAGIALGLALAKQMWLQVLLAILLSVLGFGSSFLIQDFILGLHLRNRLRLVLGLGLAAVWLLLGSWAKEPMVSGWMVGCQLLGGLAGGYGGMRTDAGRLAMTRVLGLRRYLKTVSKPDLQRTVRQQPEYFFQMAPAAAALGVDSAFANRFGGKRLPSCPYLTTGMDGHMTAKEWDRLLRRTISSLDALALRLPLEQLLRRR